MTATATRVSAERLREVIDSIGGPAVLREKQRRFRANREYLEEHRDQLKRQYPGEWIGIVDRQVKAHASEAPAVARMLRDAGEPLGGAVLHYMPIDDPNWLL